MSGIAAIGSQILKTELNRAPISAAGRRFAIVVSRWNHELTSRLANGAAEALSGAGADPSDVETFWVPGAFELPLSCQMAAESGEFDAVIALGVVIRGDTPHFDYVAGQAAAGIMQAALNTGIPILFGVITADNTEQAVARSGENEDNKGYEAALSAIEMASLVHEFADREQVFAVEGMVSPNVN
ncbi:MAG: 6,7-dimethyl-8-ribityllumazine synthase [Pyrinomonadaceae bacterium]|nr:6,7-dimethyl-8-ribityllumazine synthase [Pyrinomonadaceae bacterium]